MTGSDWIISIIAVASSLCGLASLYFAWKVRGRPDLILIGWGLQAISAVLFILANGDRGFAQGVVIAMSVVTALLCIPLLSGMRDLHDGDVKVRNRAPEASESGVLSILGNIWTFLVAGPIAGLIALFSGAALFRVMKPADGNPATAAISVIILTVLLWALVSVLLLMESRPLRRTILALGATALTACLSFI